MAGKPGEIIGETECGYCGATVYLRQTVKGSVYYRCGPGGVVGGVRMCQRRVTYGKQESAEIKAAIEGSQHGEGHADPAPNGRQPQRQPERAEPERQPERKPERYHDDRDDFLA
jgi:hypothetical protein